MLVDAGKYRSGGQIEFFMGYLPEYTLPFVLTGEQPPQAHAQPAGDGGQASLQFVE